MSSVRLAGSLLGKGDDLCPPPGRQVGGGSLLPLTLLLFAQAPGFLGGSPFGFLRLPDLGPVGVKLLPGGVTWLIGLRMPTKALTYLLVIYLRETKTSAEQ